MHVPPDLAALRHDDAPQRVAQAEMAATGAAWVEAEAAVFGDLARFDSGAALDECPALAALFRRAGDDADAFIAGYVAAHAATLARAPLGHVPNRHFTDGCNATLVLRRTGTVILMLVAIDGRALALRPAATTVRFPPLECWDRVLAGTATAGIVAATPAGPGRLHLARSDRAVSAGDLIERDARRTALLWQDVPDRLVVLSLQRRGRRAESTAEHDLADGRFVHRSAGAPRDSRHELFVTLLGAMGRADAGPLLAEIGTGPGAEAVRWQALRAGLGLDTATGFAALDAVARSPLDPLAAPAAALRAHLLETYPQLERLAACPT